MILWAKKVAWQRRMAKNLIAGTSAMILTYGSYGLGVSDITRNLDFCFLLVANHMDSA